MASTEPNATQRMPSSEEASRNHSEIAPHEKPEDGNSSGSDDTNPAKDRNAAGKSEFVDPEKTDWTLRADGKYVLTEDDVYDQLGYSFPTWKKWTILTVIFLVQVSMNFNTSLYSNNLSNIEERFNVSAQAARCGAMIFLVLYAFGCELWAPWSEELGRWPVLQLSLGLVNIWQIPAALSPTFGGLLVARALGGLSSAGGSVTLGMVADLWEPNNQQYAVAYVVLSSVGGSVLGPIVGGFSERFLTGPGAGYRWNFWIQLIFGCFVQACHFVFVPETRATLIMDKIAKKRRKEGTHPNQYGPNELKKWNERFSGKELISIWIRPFRMFVTEPIVLFLSLLSGFSDALIFMFLQSYSLIYTDIYGFGIITTNLAFLPILVGYFIAYFSFFPWFKRGQKRRIEQPDNERAQYEDRLYWLCYTAPFLWIGLFGFAWTTLPNVHWIGSMIFAALIGIANYSIYMATIDYMIAAYGAYSASATGGNGFSRDFLAGVLTLPATPFFTNIGGARHVNYALTILACIAFLVTIPVYIFYFKGEWFRKRSPFAETLQEERKANKGRRVTSIAFVESRRASAASGQSGAAAAATAAHNNGQL